MNAEKLYQENILDHYRHPHSFGTLEHAGVRGNFINPLCGDELTVELEIADGKVKKAAFTGKGCAISVASASMLLETLPGKSVEDVDKICSRDVLDLLGIDVGPTRIKCAMVVLDCLRRAMSAYEQGQFAGKGLNSVPRGRTSKAKAI